MGRCTEHASDRPVPPVPPAPAPVAPAPGATSAWPRPHRPRVSAGIWFALGRALTPNRVLRAFARFVEGRPALRRAFTAAERHTKEAAFGCRMCGQCAVPVTGYTCPMTCPKQLRNGPCGGVNSDGGCEVFPDQRCVWVTAIERAETQGHGDDLLRLQYPIDQRQWGESSWLNYWQGRDENLWTDPIVPGERRQLPLAVVSR